MCAVALDCWPQKARRPERATLQWRGMNSTTSRRPAVSVPARALLSAGLVFIASSLGFGQSQPSSKRSRRFGPDACSPTDPAYIRTANETGGVPMFLQRSEAIKAFHRVRESTRNNMATGRPEHSRENQKPLEFPWTRRPKELLSPFR